MKSKIVLGTVFVATCVLCAVIGYRAGAHRANQVPRNVATELPSRVYFNLMAALEDLRMGRLERGTRKVEAVCFASAAIVYGDPISREDRLMRYCRPDLVQYRATYCT